MSDFVTLVYTITPTGVATQAIIAAAIDPAVVLLPSAILQAMGLRVVSDVVLTPPGTVTRTTELAFGPSAAATATAQLGSGGTITGGSGGITITGAGADYVVPPIVSFTGGGPGGANIPAYGISGHQYPKARVYLDVVATSITTPGTLYSAGTTVGLVGGLPPALFLNQQAGQSPGTPNPRPAPAANGPPYAVNNVSLVKQGRGYSAATYVQFQGGQLEAGGHQAQAIITGFGPQGQILGIQVTDPGAYYGAVPEMVFIDPTNGTAVASAGTQAAAVPLMGAGIPATATLTFGGGGDITGFAITYAGQGYVSPPTPVIYDPAATGSGGVLAVSMGVDGKSVAIDFPGLGLTTVPTVVLTPYFKSSYPDGGGQDGPFWNFPLFWALQQATACEVVPSAPLLS